MKKKLIFILLAMCLCVLFCTTAFALEGSGTASDPYVIKTVDDFMAINNNRAAHYRLEADLTLPTSTRAYIADTAHSNAKDKIPFSGVFDGNGHSITVDIQGGTGSSSDTHEALFEIVTSSTARF